MVPNQVVIQTINGPPFLIKVLKIFNKLIQQDLFHLTNLNASFYFTQQF